MSDYRILNAQDTPGRTDILLERRTATGSDYAMLRRVPTRAQDQADRFCGHSTAIGNMLNYDPEAAIPLGPSGELSRLFGPELERWSAGKLAYNHAVVEAAAGARQRIVRLTGLDEEGVSQLLTEHSRLGKRVSSIIDAHVRRVPRPDTTTTDLDAVLAPVWNAPGQ